MTRIVLSWIGTGLLKQYKLGAYKYGTACRTVDLGAQTWGVSSMQHELISCITWLSQGKTCLEALPTCTDSGVAWMGGWTFHRTISPAWGAAATLMAGGRTLSLLRGGERGDDQPHRRRWVAAALGGGGSVGNALHSLQLEEQIVPQSACVNTCCKLTGICQLHRMTGKSQDTKTMLRSI